MILVPPYLNIIPSLLQSASNLMTGFWSPLSLKLFVFWWWFFFGGGVCVCFFFLLCSLYVFSVSGLDASSFARVCVCVFICKNL